MITEKSLAQSSTKTAETRPKSYFDLYFYCLKEFLPCRRPFVNVLVDGDRK